MRAARVTIGVEPGASRHSTGCFVSNPILPPETTAWLVSSGRAGSDVNCLGVMRALGVEPEVRRVRPRFPFDMLAPRGPVDWRDRPSRPGSPIAPPFPDIAIASGRATVPYLRAVKRASGGRTFTAFMQDPRVGAGAADLIWVPAHDELRGANVVVTVTSPHLLSPERLAAAREAPDPRVLALPEPRVALVVGGASRHFPYDGDEAGALSAVAATLLDSGASVMATGSRRTPPAVATAVRAVLATAPGRAFWWDGTGDNPFLSMLANAGAIVVTADSVNMVGEATATGAPVHVFRPRGGHRKIDAFLAALEREGAVRPWRGALERWSYAPIDATGVIAAEMARRYRAFRG